MIVQLRKHKCINTIIHIPLSKVTFIYVLHCEDESAAFLKTFYQDLTYYEVIRM